MKKYLVTLLLISSSIAIANGPKIEPDYFNGFYLGATLGYQSNSGSYHFDQIGTVGPEDLELGYYKVNNHFSGEIGADNLDGKFFLGYGKVLKSNFYLGAEIFVDTPVIQDINVDDISSTIAHSQQSDTDYGKRKAQLSIRAHNQYGGSLKLGYLVEPRAILYVLGGTKYSDFDAYVYDKYTFITGVPTEVTTEYTIDGDKFGLMYGLGAEIMLSKKLAARLEYTYTDYSHVNGKSNTATLGQVSDAIAYINSNADTTLDISDKVFSAGIVYRFNGI
jgi:opacity protein-like surface antigen